MYSPKIPERFIPTLHHLARRHRRPMTSLVAEAIADYVARQDLAPVAEPIAASERRYGLRPAQPARLPVSHDRAASS